MQQFSPTACMYSEKHYIENKRTDTKSSQQYLEMFIYLSKCSPEYFFFKYTNCSEKETPHWQSVCHIFRLMFVGEQNCNLD